MGVYPAHDLNITKSFFYLSVVVCTLSSNSVIVFSFFQNYKMRTVTNTMVINHCLTDMLMVMSDVAFYITPDYIPSLTDSYVFCMLSVFFDSLFKVASFLSMVCIAFDRYHNLVRTGRKRMTKKRVALLIAWVWTQSSVVATPWNELIKSDTSTNTSACALVKTLPLLIETGSAFSTLSVVFKITSLLLPLLGIYCISFRIFSAGRTRRRVDIKKRSNIQRRFSSTHFANRTARAKITAILLLGIYTVFTAPFLGTVMWTMFSNDRALEPGAAFAVNFWLRLKGVLFPILYITRNRAVLNSVQKLVCCKSRTPYSSDAFVIPGIRKRGILKNHPKGPAQRISLRGHGTVEELGILCVAKNTLTKPVNFTDLRKERRVSITEETSI